MTNPRRRGRPRSTGDLVCSRCGHLTARYRVHWPEGGICHPCFTAATRTYGTCATCPHEGLLPGLTADALPRCRICSGISTPLDCRTCGREGELYRQGNCSRCVLRKDLTALLGDPPLSSPARSLVESLASVERAESIITWMRNPTVQDLLTRIGNGGLQLSHDTFDALPDNGAVRHLRALCVREGLLETRDEAQVDFDRWIPHAIAQAHHPADQLVLHQFAIWHHRARITAIAASGRSANGPTRAAKQEISTSRKFLNHLRQRGLDLQACSQLDIDHWLATGPTTRTLIRTFIAWSVRSQHCPRHLFVARRTANTTPMLTEEVRIQLIRSCLTSDTELRTKVAAILVLLYAQPISKIATLTRDDISRTDTHTMLNLGRQPAPVPAPFDQLLNAYLDTSSQTGTQPNGSNWLFPGGRPGTHLHRTSLMNDLRAMGLDLRGSKNAALRQLVKHAPAPVVAELIGYSHPVIHRHATEAQNGLARYVGLRKSTATTRDQDAQLHSNEN